MSNIITERIAAYDLLDEERAALSAVLHRIDDRKRDRRKPEVNVEETTRQALLNAVICRGAGLSNLPQKLKNILSHIEIYRKEYRI